MELERKFKLIAWNDQLLAELLSYWVSKGFHVVEMDSYELIAKRGSKLRGMFSYNEVNFPTLLRMKIVNEGELIVNINVSEYFKNGGSAEIGAFFKKEIADFEEMLFFSFKAKEFEHIDKPVVSDYLFDNVEKFTKAAEPYRNKKKNYLLIFIAILSGFILSIGYINYLGYEKGLVAYALIILPIIVFAIFRLRILKWKQLRCPTCGNPLTMEKVYEYAISTGSCSLCDTQVIKK